MWTAGVTPLKLKTVLKTLDDTQWGAQIGVARAIKENIHFKTKWR